MSEEGFSEEGVLNAEIIVDHTKKGKDYEVFCYLVWEIFGDGRTELRGVAFYADRMKNEIMNERGFDEHIVAVEKRNLNHLFGHTMLTELKRLSKKKMSDPYRGYSPEALRALGSK